LGHRIQEVISDSIAHELEIAAGDVLLQINGQKIRDVLDYRFLVQSEELVIEIKKPDDEIWELEIEKDADEDLGLVFEQPLMSAKRNCRNKCIFCFIDQQPPEMRPSLYVKDDDVRLSFLHGNYVTLTNLSSDEIRRIADYHLSPLRISVHSADMELRKKMMGCDAAANLFEALNAFGNAGILMHFQAVLCKGINDGANLDYTIKTLSEQKGAESLAVVPQGITRFREGLNFSAAEAEAVIDQVEKWQIHFLKKSGKSFVFAADEWYIVASRPLPKFNQYEDFPQLDNGVGMLRLFEHEFLRAVRKAGCETRAPISIGIITGVAAEKFMRGLAEIFENARPETKITVFPIINNFFGENITVSGLLTGTDITAQLKCVTEDVLFIPANAIRDGIMLDGTTLETLSEKLRVPVKVGSSDGGEFYGQLASVQKGG
jgi:putative radical SAM enzyme (TIGR03279 family)